MRAPAPAVVRFARAVACVACVGAGLGCGPAVVPIEAWAMALSRVRECSVVGEGATQCTSDDELAGRTTRGRWVFDHGAEASVAITLENGATFAGIYFDDDGATLQDETPPCFGQGGLCYFARDRSTFSDGPVDCRSGAQHLVVARLTEEDGERKLEAVVSDVVQELEVVDGECQLVSFTETVDAGTGVVAPQLSLARERNGGDAS